MTMLRVILDLMFHMIKKMCIKFSSYMYVPCHFIVLHVFRRNVFVNFALSNIYCKGSLKKSP